MHVPQNWGVGGNKLTILLTTKDHYNYLYFDIYYP